MDFLSRRIQQACTYTQSQQAVYSQCNLKCEKWGSGVGREHNRIEY